MAESSKNIRTCRMCGKEYRYCDCAEYAHLPKFMLAFCGENCNDIDIILSHYGAKMIDAETAYEQLRGKDVSRMEFWNDSFKKVYDEIMQIAGSKENALKVEEPVEEKQPVMEETKNEDVPRVESRYKAESKRYKLK